MQHGWDTIKVHNQLMVHINHVPGERIIIEYKCRLCLLLQFRESVPNQKR